MNNHRTSICLSSLLISLIWPSFAHAADYYVATTGNDSNLGTIDNPWRTVQKAANTIVAGDTAYVRGGTYSEYLIKFSHSGSWGSPITIKGYPGETAVIDGGFTIASGRRPVFDIDFIDYIILDRLTIKRGDTANVFVAYNGTATGITIKNCDMQDFVANDNSGHVYLDSGADNVTIEYNKLHGVQGTSGNESGIKVFTIGNLYIRNNEIYSTGFGIHYKHSLDNGSTTVIENNLLYNLTRWGIVSSKKGAIIRHNIVRNVSGTGILIFEEAASCNALVSTDNQILHNSVIDTVTGIELDRSSLCPGAVNTLVRDNIIYNCSSSELRCFVVYPYYSGSDISNTTFSNNIIYSSFSAPIRILGNYYSTSSAPLTGSNNQQAQPLFIDYSNKDFTLQPNSPGWHSASDGTNVGAIIGTVGVNPTAPRSPENLRIVP